MKTCQFLLITLTCFLAFNHFEVVSAQLTKTPNGGVIIGNCSEETDYVLDTEDVKEKPHLGRPSYEEESFSFKDDQIKCVKVLPYRYNGNQVEVSVVSGGVNQNNIRLRFESQPGQGIYYQVLVMG